MFSLAALGNQTTEIIAAFKSHALQAVPARVKDMLARPQMCMQHFSSATDEDSPDFRSGDSSLTSSYRDASNSSADMSLSSGNNSPTGSGYNGALIQGSVAGLAELIEPLPTAPSKDVEPYPSMIADPAIHTAVLSLACVGAAALLVVAAPFVVCATAKILLLLAAGLVIVSAMFVLSSGCNIATNLYNQGFFGKSAVKQHGDKEDRPEHLNSQRLAAS